MSTLYRYELPIGQQLSDVQTPFGKTGQLEFSAAHAVKAYEVGPNGRLTLPALLRELHESAQRHAHSHGFGYRQMQARGLTWALVALDLHFDVLPKGDAPYSTYTSVHASRGPTVLRDYAATSDAGSFATGQSMWVVIDLASRKAVAPPPDLRSVLATLESPIQDTVPRVSRLRTPASPGNSLYALPVGYHDCDFNGHLNNVVAARWLLDAAIAADPSRRDLARLQLTYFNEALQGENLTATALSSPAGTAVETSLLRKGDLRPVACARCTYRMP